MVEEISFALSEEQQMMQDTVRQLVQANVIDNIHQWDENRKLDSQVVQKFWELGIIQSMIPEEYGGFGMGSSPILHTLILEELAYGDMTFAVYAMLPALFVLPIVHLGTEEQKSKYLPEFCSESFVAATLAANELEVGFDIWECATKAEKKGSTFVLNGKKCFVPLADESKYMIVVANYDNCPHLFILEKDTPGLVIGEREKNCGWWALPTFEVSFDNCSIPENNKLGDHTAINWLLERTRTAMAAIGTGISRASYEYSKKYARERQQFGEPIASRQSIAFMIAEMAYEVDAMRLLTWKAASTIELGINAQRESFLAKIYAGEMTMKLTDYGVQILGGHGYIRDHPVERYYRNGRSIAICEAMAII
ncbi:MAG: acyl-CoA dehydrogenase family protein [Spirochaetes bacterium]|nr:acyl-CoA dehydrogenase family protein [Spirochaetota bacterium]